MDVDAVLSSTNFDRAFAVNAIHRTYELQYPDGTLEARLDFDDWNITRILRQITAFTSLTYNGYRKFTTLCNMAYGNTTIYRLVLTYNGYIHVYEIPAGARLRFPDPQQIRDAVTDLSNFRRGARSVIF